MFSLFGGKSKKENITTQTSPVQSNQVQGNSSPSPSSNAKPNSMFSGMKLKTAKTVQSHSVVEETPPEDKTFSTQDVQVISVENNTQDIVKDEPSGFSFLEEEEPLPNLEDLLADSTKTEEQEVQEISSFSFLHDDNEPTLQALTIDEQPVEETKQSTPLHSVSTFLNNIPELETQTVTTGHNESIVDHDISNLAKKLVEFISAYSGCTTTYQTCRLSRCSIVNAIETYERIQELTAQLDTAVESEDYETADKINNEIEELQSSIKTQKDQADDSLNTAVTQEEEHLALVKSFHENVTPMTSSFNKVITDLQEDITAFTASEVRRAEREQHALETKQQTIQAQSEAILEEQERISKETESIQKAIEDDSLEEEKTKRDLLAVQLALQAEIEDLEARLLEKRASLVTTTKLIDECDERLNTIRDGYERKADRIEAMQEALLRDQATYEEAKSQVHEQQNIFQQQQKAVSIWTEDAEGDLARSELLKQITSNVAQRASKQTSVIRAWTASWQNVEEILQISREKESRIKQETQNLEAELLHIHEEEQRCLEEVADCNRILPALHAEKKVCLAAKNFKQAGVVSAEITETTNILASKEQRIEELHQKAQAVTEKISEVSNNNIDSLEELRITNEKAEKLIISVFALRSIHMNSLSISSKADIEKLRDALVKIEDEIKNPTSEVYVERDNVKKQLLTQRTGKALEGLWKNGRIGYSVIDEKNVLIELLQALELESSYYTSCIEEGDRIIEVKCQKHAWNSDEILEQTTNEIKATFLSVPEEIEYDEKVHDVSSTIETTPSSSTTDVNMESQNPEILENEIETHGKHADLEEFEPEVTDYDDSTIEEEDTDLVSSQEVTQDENLLNEGLNDENVEEQNLVSHDPEIPSGFSFMHDEDVVTEVEESSTAIEAESQVENTSENEDGNSSQNGGEEDTPSSFSFLDS